MKKRNCRKRGQLEISTRWVGSGSKTLEEEVQKNAREKRKKNEEKKKKNVAKDKGRKKGGRVHVVISQGDDINKGQISLVLNLGLLFIGALYAIIPKPTFSQMF